MARMIIHIHIPSIMNTSLLAVELDEDKEAPITSRSCEKRKTRQDVQFVFGASPLRTKSPPPPLQRKSPPLNPRNGQTLHVRKSLQSRVTKEASQSHALSRQNVKLNLLKTAPSVSEPSVVTASSSPTLNIDGPSNFERYRQAHAETGQREALVRMREQRAKAAHEKAYESALEDAIREVASGSSSVRQGGWAFDGTNPPPLVVPPYKALHPSAGENTGVGSSPVVGTNGEESSSKGKLTLEIVPWRRCLPQRPGGLHEVEIWDENIRIIHAHFRMVLRTNCPATKPLMASQIRIACTSIPVPFSLVSHARQQTMSVHPPLHITFTGSQTSIKHDVAGSDDRVYMGIDETIVTAREWTTLDPLGTRFMPFGVSIPADVVKDKGSVVFALRAELYFTNFWFAGEPASAGWVQMKEPFLFCVSTDIGEGAGVPRKRFVEPPAWLTIPGRRTGRIIDVEEMEERQYVF